MSKYKITAFELKLAFLEYYRFRRQCVAVDEFNGADVIADSGSEIIEIEVKVNKYDLMKNELKKVGKHQSYAVGGSWAMCHPNKFLFGVTEELVEDAKQLVQQLNPKYGIIAFNTESFRRNIDDGYGWAETLRYVRIAKSAKTLHDRYQKQQKLIAKRASCRLIGLMQRIHKQKVLDYVENENNEYREKRTAKT